MMNSSSSRHRIGSDFGECKSESQFSSERLLRERKRRKKLNLFFQFCSLHFLCVERTAFSKGSNSPPILLPRLDA